MNPKELREFAEEYWRGIDVSAYQPVCHGTPRSAEELEHARRQLDTVDALCRQNNGKPHPSLKQLFMVVPKAPCTTDMTCTAPNLKDKLDTHCADTADSS